MKRKWMWILVMVGIFGWGATVYGNGFGLKGGIQYSKFDNGFKLTSDPDVDADYAYNDRFKFGVFYRLDIGRRFSLQPEILYSTKGPLAYFSDSYSYKSPYDDITYSWRSETDLRLDIHYIEVPLLFKYDLIKSRSLAVQIFTGPYMAFKLNGSISGTLDYFFISNRNGEVITEHETIVLEDSEEYENLNELFERSDFGVVFGAGFEIAAGSGRLTFDIRYTLGLTEVFKLDFMSDDFSMRNRSLSLMVGYAFN